MAKVVVYTLIATAFVILIVLFPSGPSKQHGQDHGGGRNRRLGYKFPAATFDPLVAELERLAQNHGIGDPIKYPLHLENHSFPDEFADAYEYFSEGKLNITLRLIVLFPLLDNSNDGVVSFKELEVWIAQKALQGLNYRTEKELALLDKDEDGIISFREYLSQFSNEDLGT
jgi:hypothetical protein